MRKGIFHPCLSGDGTAEVNDGAVTADTTVTLTLSGAATSGTDYTVSPSTLPSIAIAAGQVSGTAAFSIDPTEDPLQETGGETVTISGTKSSGDTSITSVGSATVTITDDYTPT